jgi:hypothetical protein
MMREMAEVAEAGEIPALSRNGKCLDTSIESSIA